MHKKSPIIINIPHSSLYIPKEEMQFFDRTKLIRELMVMTDHCCDDLFDSEHEMLIFPISRLVCDFERFRDDKDEIMAAKGMGAIYTRCSDMTLLRQIDSENRERILNRYYDQYHNLLEDLVAERIDMYGRCLIIDGHSFYESPLPYEIDQKIERPDICIGTDDYHTRNSYAELLMEYFMGKGYSVAINTPFAGAIVPMKYYLRNNSVQSIMIEINRRLYIQRDGALKPGYLKTKEDIRDAVVLLESMV